MWWNLQAWRKPSCNSQCREKDEEADRRGLKKTSRNDSGRSFTKWPTTGYDQNRWRVIVRESCRDYVGKTIIFDQSNQHITIDRIVDSSSKPERDYLRFYIYPTPPLGQDICPVSWGCRIHWLHLCRGVSPPPLTSVLVMTLNNLMVRFQQCWSFGECGVPLHCHRSQVHSGPEW